MSNLYYLQKAYLYNSKEFYEKEFIRFMNNRYGEGYCTAANNSEDRNHVDGYIHKDGKDWSYDFKQIKKIKRGAEPNQDIEWLELHNGSKYNNGGWLYGKEDFIIFDQLDSYIVTEREKLLNYTLQKINNQQEPIEMPEEVNDVKFFTKYHRKGKSDCLVLVPTSDIKQIAAKIIYKNNNNQ